MNRRNILLTGIAALAAFTFIVVPLAGRALAQAAKPEGGSALAQWVMIQIEAPDDLGSGIDPVHGLPDFPESDILQLAAEALGMSRDELVAARENGQTLDDLARERGMTKDEVVDAIEAAMLASHRAAIEKAVADGELDREVADKLLSGLEIALELDDLPVADRLGGRLFGHVGRLELSTAHVLDDDKLDIYIHTSEDGERPLTPRLNLEGMGSGVFSWFDEPLDEATLDAVTNVLEDAARDGRLTQEQVDQALQRLEPVPGPTWLERLLPALEILRSRDDDSGAKAAPDAVAPVPRQREDSR